MGPEKDKMPDQQQEVDETLKKPFPVSCVELWDSFSLCLKPSNQFNNIRRHGKVISFLTTNNKIKVATEPR